MQKITLFALALTLLNLFNLQAQQRWHITPNGAIEWNPGKQLPHYDHIEMSGKKVSVVLRYGVNEKGNFELERSVVWPLLRTIPNNTHASLTQRFGFNIPAMLIVNGLTLQEPITSAIQIKGLFSVTNQYALGFQHYDPLKPITRVPVVEINTQIFPSTDQAALCEIYYLKNISNRKLSISIPNFRNVYYTDASKGVEGSYQLVSSLQGDGTYLLEPGKTLEFCVNTQAFSKNQQELSLNAVKELEKRRSFIDELSHKLTLHTPDSIINTAFEFAKIRASESIFDTKGGLMHGPGGESYYAAIWANDQAEYVGPFFPYLGYDIGNKASLNAYKQFARFMNADFKALPSSIIAEGLDTWGGAGDRGDAAMIAYGASRYALVRANISEARDLWPLIQWCLEFCQRKLTPEGVVASDADELEGRFPAGKANLCTSSLYYDALISAAYLSKELGVNNSISNNYLKQAQELRKNIHLYFGATVEGFDTYRYYKENTVLRSWICMPLTVGIFDKAKGTIDALFSPRLWTTNGLLTQAGSETFWDRSTLYALRGIYAAGETEKATDYLHFYSSQRLLGEHVPYPIEAWPEGSQRHLSAESGLYCRIITEGLFGIRPTGFNSFELSPRLPSHWDHMELNQLNGFGRTLNINVSRVNKNIKIVVTANAKTIFNKTISNGTTISIQLR